MDKRRGLRERMTKGSGAANGGSTATGSSEEDVDGQRRRSTKCAVDFSRLDVATLRKYRRVNRLEDISNGTKEQLLPGIIQHFGSQVRRTVDACSLRTRETCWVARARVGIVSSLVSFAFALAWRWSRTHRWIHRPLELTFRRFSSFLVLGRYASCGDHARPVPFDRGFDAFLP
mmetsp:Transcript_3809/g.24064  ORF Transcript_3809/g.24064 Transcript_3809/m.24064 type:complete len:174 (+) Transcript_3809:533-1054(+)